MTSSGLKETFEVDGVHIHKSWKRTYNSMTPEQQRLFIRNHKYGDPISFSRWFRGEPIITEEKTWRRWMCPFDDCDGEMVYTGTIWPTGDPGYHHTCSKDDCKFTAAIKGHEYPEKVSNG